MTEYATPDFELPKKLEKILASLAGYYGHNNSPLLQKVLVNSEYRVVEEWSYDNWNGGTYGHALYLYIPQPLYISCLSELDSLSGELRERINKLSNTQNEFIEEVFLEPQTDGSLDDWREKSGVLLQTPAGFSSATEEQLNAIWAPGFFRLFLSHKSDVKVKATELKEAMLFYGVSCFVAHEDIEPTKEWLTEIERALFSMDALAAMLTEGYGDSKWTDQEVGVAIGRRVVIIPIRMGTDPYGFMGKYQGLSVQGNSSDLLAAKLYNLLWKKEVLKPQLIDSLIHRFETSGSFEQSNKLVSYFDRVDRLKPEQIDALERAFESNRQLSQAWKVRQRLPQLLKRLRKNV